MLRALAVGMAVLVGTGVASASPITVGGVTFPGGVESFADAVVSYSPGFGVEDGPATATCAAQIYSDPDEALGLPDYNGCTGMVSLGDYTGPGSATLVVQFTDNSLTANGTSDPDLYIFEVGTFVESYFVDISADGVDWIALGLYAGQPTGNINIDGVAGVTLGTLYSFVRLRDDPNQTSLTANYFRGPDIDAIGAISSAPPDPALVPEPGTVVLFGSGLVGAIVLRSRRNRRRG